MSALFLGLAGAGIGTTVATPEAERPQGPFMACPKTLPASLPQVPDLASLKLASLAAHKQMFFYDSTEFQA